MQRKKLLLLALIAIIIVALTAPNLTSLVAMVVALMALAGVCIREDDMRATPPDGTQPGCIAVPAGSFCPAKESFSVGSGLPGPRPPYGIDVASISDAEPTDSFDSYPGAIDETEDDSSYGPAIDAGGQPSRDDPGSDDPGMRGHTDRGEDDNADAPEGNPFELSRTAAPRAAGPEIDDEAGVDEMDGDELLTYQARSRNDATRATSGTMRRLKEMDKFFREEVEEREDIPWWGRHEL